jgi:cob(I)alamin adenosyltransferase
MTRIYTKTGDQGETGLFGGGRVGKDDPRVEAYGEVDELNASVGFARSAANAPEDLDPMLAQIQDQLFTVGAKLATPREAKASSILPPIDPTWAAGMEEAMDRFELELPPLTNFVLQGGTQAASALHLARTVCRRAERKVVTLHRQGLVDADVVVYLNRLSDLLFTMARVANLRAGVNDVLWVPKRP